MAITWTIEKWKEAEAEAEAQAKDCGEAWAEAEGKRHFHLADQLQRRAQVWAEVAENIKHATTPLPE